AAAGQAECRLFSHEPRYRAVLRSKREVGPHARVCAVLRRARPLRFETRIPKSPAECPANREDSHRQWLGKNCETGLLTQSFSWKGRTPGCPPPYARGRGTRDASREPCRAWSSDRRT